VLGGLKSMTGQLEFFSADEFEVLNAAEHFMCTDVEWDPTGRYVATAVNHMHQMENGFKVWLFNGQLLYKCAPAHVVFAQPVVLSVPTWRRREVWLFNSQLLAPVRALDFCAPALPCYT